MRRVRVGGLTVGAGAPLAVILGPCGLESRDLALTVAETCARLCATRGIPFVFKGSFDKANRTSGGAWRGPGLDAGLRILEEVRRQIGVPVTTDIHLPSQAGPVAEIVDLLQVPAFLCRQTDLLTACAATGLPVNIKKGQFVAPDAMGHAVAKASGPGGVLVTERGTTFGHGDLVVDLRGLPILASLGVPVVFDATHSVQRPSMLGTHSGGNRRFVRCLARAAIAAGADAVFAEVHPDPASALSDAATQLPLDALPGLLDEWVRLAELIRALAAP
ncbi:MAG: 2-dehydro-3-deoxyphosphooctonate aldolase (KDO 8-P synthase) [Myxococcota bacterium]